MHAVEAAELHGSENKSAPCVKVCRDVCSVHSSEVSVREGHCHSELQWAAVRGSSSPRLVQARRVTTSRRTLAAPLNPAPVWASAQYS